MKRMLWGCVAAWCCILAGYVVGGCRGGKEIGANAGNPAPMVQPMPATVASTGTGGGTPEIPAEIKVCTSNCEIMPMMATVHLTPEERASLKAAEQAQTAHPASHLDVSAEAGKLVFKADAAASHVNPGAVSTVTAGKNQPVHAMVSPAARALMAQKTASAH